MLKSAAEESLAVDRKRVSICGVLRRRITITAAVASFSEEVERNIFNIAMWRQIVAGKEHLDA